jgi:hypothetical protein
MNCWSIRVSISNHLWKMGKLRWLTSNWVLVRWRKLMLCSSTNGRGRRIQNYLNRFKKIIIYHISQKLIISHRQSRIKLQLKVYWKSINLNKNKTILPSILLKRKETKQNPKSYINPNNSNIRTSHNLKTPAHIPSNHYNIPVNSNRSKPTASLIISLTTPWTKHKKHILNSWQIHQKNNN